MDFEPFMCNFDNKIKIIDMKKSLSILLLMAVSFGFAQDKAAQLVDAYIKAIGGQKKIASVKSVLQKQTISQMGQEIEVESYQNVNGDGYMKMNMAGMDLIVYAVKDGKGFRMNQMMGYDELSPEEVKKMEDKHGKIFGDIVYMKDKEGKIKYLGTEEMDGKKYEVVELKQDENSFKLYFDPETHLLKYTVVDTDNGTVVNEIAEYKEVDGLKFPSKMVTKVGDQTLSTIEVKEIILNPKEDQIDQEAFKMPE